MSAETESRATSLFVLPLVLGFVGVSLFVAVLSAESGLALLCILVLSTTAGAKLWGRLSLSHLHSALRVDKPRVFPGETLGLAAEIENAKLLPVWFQVSVPLGTVWRDRIPDGRLRRDTGLSSFQNVTFDWQLTAERRGVHRLGPIQLEAADPLGFYPCSKLAQSCDIIVYPRLVALKPFGVPRRDFLGRPGRSSPIEDPTYIDGTRDYQAGRPARYIHWKASARHARLVEKRSQSTEREKVLIVVRVERFAESELLEACLSAAASLAVQLDRSRYAVGLSTNARLQGGGDQALCISSSPGHIARILETLARIEPVASDECVQVLRRGSLPSSSVTVVCFTYAADAGWESLRATLRLRRASLVSVLCGPADPSLVVDRGVNEREYRLEDLGAE